MKTPLHFLFVVSFASFVEAQSEFQVVSWNVESGGARPSHIAREVRDDFEGVELWGLSEVGGDGDAARYEVAAEEGEGINMERIVGTTGGSDRLVVLYDAGRFQLVESFELDHINVSGTVRAPLVAKLRDQVSGRTLLFMVNHLYRGSSAGRHEQAALLNTWATEQTSMVIAVGDYNFDWHYENGDTDHDEGFDHMVANGVWEWVRPAALFPTQSSTEESVLDFVFWSGSAQVRAGWSAQSSIYVRDGDFSNVRLRSDHRPVKASFSYTGGAPGEAAVVGGDGKAARKPGGVKPEWLARLNVRREAINKAAASSGSKKETGGLEFAPDAAENFKADGIKLIKGKGVEPVVPVMPQKSLGVDVPVKGLKFSTVNFEKSVQLQSRFGEMNRSFKLARIAGGEAEKTILPVVENKKADRYAALAALPDIGSYFFAQPESVCHPDERTQVTDTQLPPWNGNCQLIITMNNGSMARGTGWLMTPTFVVTAGHCVHEGEGGSFFRSIEVIPGMNGGQMPFGSQVVGSENFRASTGWKVNGSEIDDYGAIRLSTAFSGVAVTPAAVATDEQLQQSILELSGYPADKPTGTQWAHFGSASTVLPRRLRYMIDTFGGHSGSAVTMTSASGRTAVGIHNYGGCPNKCTRITAEVMADLNNWIQQ